MQQSCLFCTLCMILVTKRSEQIDTSFLTDTPAEVISLDNLHNAPNDLSKYKSLVILGGDGTVLRILQMYSDLPVIFAINFGNIGFLTTFGKNVLADKAFIQKVQDKGRAFHIFARKRLLFNNMLYFVNEAVLTTKKRRLNKFVITIDNQIDCYEVKGDSLLVSTSTGSTAYNHSVNGPIILNDEVMIINVIAPNKSSFRPIVCSISSHIQVECASGDTICLLDGIEHDCRFFDIRYDGNNVQFACDKDFDMNEGIKKILSYL